MTVLYFQCKENVFAHFFLHMTDCMPNLKHGRGFLWGLANSIMYQIINIHPRYSNNNDVRLNLCSDFVQDNIPGMSHILD